jgi:ketosteroid isomerase-like protein
MKGILKVILFCFSLSVISNAQRNNYDLNIMIAAEYSFVSSAAELGTRDAFLKFIADDGILLRPNPVNGKKYLEESKPGSGFLSWYPCKAFVCKAGDMGFTTGPWEWKKNKNDSAALAFGNFCTVWQKQMDGKWKFVFDFGNDNDKPKTIIEPLKVDTSNKMPNSLIRGMHHGKPEELFELDKQFSNLSIQTDALAAYKKFINEDSRLLRDGNYPIIGIWTITDFLSQRGLHYQFNPAGGKISSSKDFGFTYGVLKINNTETNSSENYNYLRVWKKDGKRWVIAVDVAKKIKS